MGKWYTQTLILTIFTLGCGSTQEPHTKYFDKYIGNFPKEVTSSIRFVKTIKKGAKDTYLGVCSHKYNLIELKSSFWFAEETTDAERRALLWHELGHCMLGLQHNDKETDGVADSIMHHSLQSYEDMKYMVNNPNLDRFTLKFLREIGLL